MGFSRPTNREREAYDRQRLSHPSPPLTTGRWSWLSSAATTTAGEGASHPDVRASRERRETAAETKRKLEVLREISREGKESLSRHPSPIPSTGPVRRCAAKPASSPRREVR